MTPTILPSSKFSDHKIAIAELMSNVQFTNTQMNEVLAWQDANGASYEEAAVYFLTNYKDIWGNWLNDEARDKLAPLLN